MSLSIAFNVEVGRRSLVWLGNAMVLTLYNRVDLFQHVTGMLFFTAAAIPHARRRWSIPVIDPPPLAQQLYGLKDKAGAEQRFSI